MESRSKTPMKNSQLINQSLIYKEFIISKKNRTVGNKYGLLTKRVVKMAGYWLSFFFACLWTEAKLRSINTQKKNEANIQPS